VLVVHAFAGILFQVDMVNGDILSCCHRLSLTGTRPPKQMGAWSWLIW
jgi:hypothetical protein